MKLNITEILLLVAAALLLLCLAPMPYGYFTFVRIVTILACIVLFFKTIMEIEEEGKEADKTTPYVIVGCVLTAILFQPIINISLGRTGWNVADVIIAIFFIGIALHRSKQLSDK